MDFDRMQRKGWRLVAIMAIAELSLLVVWAIGETTLEPNYLTNSGPYRPYWMSLPYVCFWAALLLLNVVLGFCSMAHVSSRLSGRPSNVKSDPADFLWLFAAWLAPGLLIFINREYELYASRDQPGP